jgi:hypothetical protein
MNMPKHCQAACCGVLNTYEVGISGLTFGRFSPARTRGERYRLEGCPILRGGSSWRKL